MAFAALLMMRPLLLLIVISSVFKSSVATSRDPFFRKTSSVTSNLLAWRKDTLLSPRSSFMRNMRDSNTLTDGSNKAEQEQPAQEAENDDEQVELTSPRVTRSISNDDTFYSAEEEEDEDESWNGEEDDEGTMEMTSLLLDMRGGAVSDNTLATTPRGGGAKKKQVQDDDSTAAGMISCVFNLVNNVAGAGILALSAGMTGGTGWIPAVLLCVALGIISSHSFKIIGEACELTGEKDFKGLWARTIGPQTTYMVDSIIAFMCVAVSIIYSGILGDVFTPLLKEAGMPDIYNGRTSNIIAITATLLLPLSLIKNLSALAFTSILGFCAISYTVFFIVVRALDGSYKLGSGRFVQEGAASLLDAMPSFQKSSLWGFGFTSLVLVSNLGLAFIAHYNAPTFYRQLRNTNSQRFGRMVDVSFTILVALYIITMLAGYSTFGDVCRGNLLLNYHPHDILSTLGRLATGFSILFGFPLVMCGAREGLIGAADSCGFPALGKDQFHFPLVATMLAFVTVISCSVEDVSLVVGLTGAAMGAFIVYICPAILYTRAVKQVKGKDSVEYGKAKYTMALVPFGLFVGSLGVYMTIKEAMA
ncbi:Putative sodium-coupled neutral amino acid transporter 10 [Seminavis robusta]|uniref:Sodium-coupled neutral amino acid transporter 10 n=1 Tax=Seminavis robusta TaxID=568900 RepID=A0A9N8E336_9STRA|nr:Putative sodium-coupled neutral amino acid transporter 10 [Seminavis robusta]|eukprot:Sro607_g174610.1 Putative sodium-coupled neutral amino acid transporter 10 (589) ;mRNA; r:16267-18130